MTENLLSGSDNTTLDPNKNYLEELVGEGRKFKDNETLARSKFESDMYVKLLEKKLDQREADYKLALENNISKAEFDKLLEKLNTSSSTQPPVNDTKKPEINMDQLDSLVSNKLKEFEDSRKQAMNYQMVKDKLAERFGTNLESHLTELGLSGESAAQLAKTNPDLLLKALGVDQKQGQPGYQAPPRNTSGFTPKPAQKRTWSYYQELKSKNPKLYSDRKTNIQMQKDYIDLGSAFEDGDFHA